MSRILFLAIVFFNFIGCKNESDLLIPNPTTTNGELYFPPLTSEEWETTNPTSLNWNMENLANLNTFLQQENTKSFMVLVDGKIVVEEYFNGHTAQNTWQWNSAGKTLVTAITGIAQAEGFIDIHHKVGEYLGTGWTDAPNEKEQLIQPNHLLTMTSGLNDEKQLVIKRNLTYLADAGTRWAYGNVFQKLMDVVSQASGQTFDNYFNTQLMQKIGMDGFWKTGLIFTIYHSTTRGMARFGLLTLNQGKWEVEQVIDQNFFKASIQPSQPVNPSYGYMWWLNGKPQFMLPSGQEIFSGPLIPNAPADLYAAMGANEQRLYIIPSKNMVVIRMGEAASLNDASFALSGFDNVFWEYFNGVIN